MASSSKPKSVRRDLMNELGEAGELEDERWVAKPNYDEDGGEAIAGEDHGGNCAPWYRESVKEAAVANTVYDQNDKWAEAEKTNLISTVKYHHAEDTNLRRAKLKSVDPSMVEADLKKKKPVDAVKKRSLAGPRKFIGNNGLVGGLDHLQPK
ncbi:unnamed protein product [Arabis nemorensis]|uniref:Uncharacterized protein n=1 Tax=Arabis nemorensis TaxID=586526 RepID=A0A565CS72_9BRAS|nr:unnamed protein product [Arabis nemorensis]